MRFNPRPFPENSFSTAFRGSVSMPDLAEYMTAKEAAQDLGFTVAGVHSLIKKEKLEAVMVGRMYLVSRKSLKDYVDKTVGLSKNDPTRGKVPQE